MTKKEKNIIEINVDFYKSMMESSEEHLNKKQEPLLSSIKKLTKNLLNQVRKKKKFFEIEDLAENW